MSSLIPFQSRPERSSEPSADAASATIVDVAAHAGRPRSRAALRRRSRRNWDPEFHVDLLTF